MICINDQYINEHFHVPGRAPKKGEICYYDGGGSFSNSFYLRGYTFGFDGGRFCFTPDYVVPVQRDAVTELINDFNEVRETIDSPVPTSQSA